MNNKDILQIALRQSAVDCSCVPEDFLRAANSTHESVTSDQARKYLSLPHICALVSYGSCVVACGKRELLPELERYMDGVSNIADCFDTPRLYELDDILAPYDARICFMATYYLPDVDAVYASGTECPYELRILEQRDFAELYVPQWSNALCRDRAQLDVLGVGAYDGDTLVGLAGCSADCAEMWQIGVDVLPMYRRQGIASALTNRLAREILLRDKAPFYCAAWSNVKSAKNALRSGFRPAWAEMSARPKAKIEEILKG